MQTFSASINSIHFQAETSWVFYFFTFPSVLKTKQKSLKVYSVSKLVEKLKFNATTILFPWRKVFHLTAEMEISLVDPPVLIWNTVL